jgi:hypothetical protein
MRVRGQCHALAMLYTRGKDHWYRTGCWVDLRTGMDTEAGAKNANKAREKVAELVIYDTLHRQEGNFISLLFSFRKESRLNTVTKE